MAEALATVLIDQLSSILLGNIQAEVSLVKNAEEDVRKLKSNLEAIQDVLEDAEKKQLTDRSVKRWLDNLKEVSFEMDNVLDEWNTAILELKIKKEAGEDVLVDDQKKKVCFSLPSPFSCCGTKVNRLAVRHDIAHKIKDLKDRLADIASEKNQFNLSLTSTEKLLERPRPTTSFIDEAKIEGRDGDRDVLVSKLCESSSQNGVKELLIIPIVGGGGLGKTTLAQLVYNDEKVKAHFDQLIWVCVSDPFDEMKVAKAIIESFKDPQVPNSNELQTLLKCVQECVEGKRFLLILDDVWTEDETKWDQLKQPLKYGATGSRVVVTTRKEGVAMMMGASKHMITLELLSKEHCWLIFKRLALSERTEDESHQLEEIGQQIATKCKGLPLAARTLGSLMRSKKTKTQWENVLRSELWNDLCSELFTKELFASLMLSYVDLSPKEKRCFLYCAIFPKDHRIDRDQLIQMWMSQNILNCGTNLEEEGDECFDRLAMQSFFQNFEISDSDGSITHCKMHDIVHDFAQFLTKDECINLEVDGVEGKILKPLDEKTHHLTLAFGSDAKFPTTLYHSEMKKRNLRTLFIVQPPYKIITVDFSLLLQLTCLRSLTLSQCGIKTLPADIGKLKHLRHLDLSRNGKLEELPDSLCDLCNLQTLDLSNCYNLRRLPKGMGKLINLRHLYVFGCFELEGLSKGIGKLRSLRSFDALIIPEKKEAFFDVGDVNSVENLRLARRFEIGRCRNLGGRDEAEKVDLKNISQHVTDLRLCFGEKGRLEEDSAILEGLEPHQNLRRLDIEGYMAPTLSPRWMMSLINLRHIHLWKSDRCEMFASLGKLPLLESIDLFNMSVKKVCLTKREGEEESSTKREIPAKLPITLFPKLKKISFVIMDEWEKWEGGEGDAAAAATSTGSTLNTIMPCLTTLSFNWCPRLQVLPDFLKTTTSLKQLIILGSDILGEWCQERRGREWAKISHAPDIRLNNKYVRKDGVWIEEHNPNLERPSPSD